MLSRFSRHRSRRRRHRAPWGPLPSGQPPRLIWLKNVISTRVRRHRRVFYVLGPVVLLATSIFLLWKVPWWIDSGHLNDKSLSTGSAALVTGLRTAIVQLIAIVGASIALVFTAHNYMLARRGQVTERFTKALERLGSEEQYVRLGGVLALQEIIRDDADHRDSALDVLLAFIRERTPKRTGVTSATRSERIATVRRDVQRGRNRSAPDPELPDEPDPDVQRALLVLLEHRPESSRVAPVGIPQHDPRARLNLRGLHLAGVRLTGADLRWVDFTDTDLTKADLSCSVLSRSWLHDANLTEADLVRADLSYTRVTGCDFTRAGVAGSNLTNSFITAEQFLSTSSFCEQSHNTLTEEVREDPRVRRALRIHWQQSDPHLWMYDDLWAVED